jgi:primosomal protein N' (replication factor Y)
VRKRNSISHILSEFSKGHIDILIGTQIVTKGLHFPNVTLVGVLNADIPLNFPDFRSAERTFNLITQVAGRAGRSVKGGEVIIQTYNPVHYAIQTAKNQDYEEFFLREIKFRENLLYPPFCRIIRLVFRGSNSKKLFDSAYYAISYIQEKTKSYIALLGPAFCPLSRIKNNYRVHVIIKLKQIAALREVLKEFQEIMVQKHSLYMEIDIDPVSML